MSRWIGVDGEGVGRAPHRYVMLAAADDAGMRRVIRDMRGLHTRDCLGFLLDLGSRSRRVVGYYLGYDWTMILRDLPDETIYRLLRPELRARPADEGGGFSPVTWRGYRLHYLSGAMTIAYGKRRVAVWDAGRFFQESFVSALTRWQSVSLRFPRLAEIARMKGERESFDELRADEIEGYCLDECQYLARLMTALEGEINAIGAYPRAWHGPGSVAKAVMALATTDEYLTPTTPELDDLADRAYFGGRFEHASQGYEDGVWGHDIVSAYPHHTALLPCLACGSWTRITRERSLPDHDPTRARALVRYVLDDIGDRARWGPLPCRTHDGTILYPRGGHAGWVWDAEYRAAKIAYPNRVRFAEARVYRTRCDHTPFAFMPELFAERVRVGKGGRGIAIKLAMNSIYGSIAQRVGRSRYASTLWAGMITSDTRAQLLRAIAAAPEDVIGVATDGIYTRGSVTLERPPRAGSTLGSWESESKGRMLFVRPGIYWSLDGATMRSRGLPRRHLAEHRAAVEHALADGLERASVGYTTTFGGAKATVYRAGCDIRRSRHYGTWHAIPAHIDLTPAPKRGPDYRLILLPGVESAPYEGKRGAMARIADLHWADHE